MTFTRCKTCLYPNTKPDLVFDETGECSACISFKKRPAIDWDSRKQQLLHILDRHNGKCIVPSSGGKDSHFQVLKLIELGADVTIVTASTCQLTDIGRANIDNISRLATTIEVTPNRTVRAKLNKIGLQMVGDISWPEHASIFSIPFRVALDLKIPLIFFGECPQEAYGGPEGSDKEVKMTERWISEYGGFLGLRPDDLINVDGITEKEMKDYRLPAKYRMGYLEAYFLGQFVEWNSRRNAEIALKNGMQYRRPGNANLWKWENLDNAQTGIHDFFSYLKYGYGRLCAQISVDIREGIITREKALEVVQENDGMFPTWYMNVSLHDVLLKINMTTEEFLKTCNTFCNFDLFVQDKVEWGTDLTLKEFAC